MLASDISPCTDSHQSNEMIICL